jgi:hypothetical protein
VDINLSSNDETMHPPDPNTSIDQKVLADDDAGDVGASSVEPNTPSPIGFDMPERSRPITAGLVLVVPPSGRGGRKCPPPTTKRSNPIPPADLVMTQVELPPYHGPHSPLELVAIDFIFECMFEAFQ